MYISNRIIKNLDAMIYASVLFIAYLDTILAEINDDYHNYNADLYAYALTIKGL